MDLKVGDNIRVVTKLEIRIFLPEEYIYYDLLPGEVFTVDGLDEVNEIMLVSSVNNPMGAEIPYSKRNKIVKL